MNFKSIINFCLYLFLINTNFIFSKEEIKKEEFFKKFRETINDYDKIKDELKNRELESKKLYDELRELKKNKDYFFIDHICIYPTDEYFKLKNSIYIKDKENSEKKRSLIKKEEIKEKEIKDILINFHSKEEKLLNEKTFDEIFFENKNKYKEFFVDKLNSFESDPKKQKYFLEIIRRTEGDEYNFYSFLNESRYDDFFNNITVDIYKKIFNDDSINSQDIKMLNFYMGCYEKKDNIINSENNIIKKSKKYKNLYDALLFIHINLIDNLIEELNINK